MAYPTDEAVKALDEAAAIKARVRRHIAQWHFLPFWLKALLITGTIFETLAVYEFELQGSACFANFKITDTIDGALGGHAINMVKAPGWVGIGLVVYGLCVLLVLQLWVDFMVWYRPDLKPPALEPGKVDPLSSKEDGEEDDPDEMQVAQDLYGVGKKE
jgi:hypothetical protein